VSKISLNDNKQSLLHHFRFNVGLIFTADCGCIPCIYPANGIESPALLHNCLINLFPLMFALLSITFNEG